MVIYMMDNGIKIKKTALGFMNGKTEQFMKANGFKTKLILKEDYNSKKGTFLKGDGKQIRRMAMENM